MNILALDIATKTGWAQMENNAITSGVYEVPFIREDLGRAGTQFSLWLFDRLNLRLCDMLVIEKPFKGPNADTTYRLFGLAFTAHTIANEAGKRRHEVSPKTLKKFTTDNGNASKKDMIAAVREWGFDPQDDNEADALALLTYAKEKL